MLFKYITLDTLECKEIIIFYLNMKVSVKKSVAYFFKSPVSFKSKLNDFLFFSLKYAFIYALIPKDLL